jgi:hypothetical protein
MHFKKEKNASFDTININKQTNRKKKHKKRKNKGQEHDFDKTNMHAKNLQKSESVREVNQFNNLLVCEWKYFFELAFFCQHFSEFKLGSV